MPTQLVSSWEGTSTVTSSVRSAGFKRSCTMTTMFHLGIIATTIVNEKTALNVDNNMIFTTADSMEWVQHVREKHTRAVSTVSGSKHPPTLKVRTTSSYCCKQLCNADSWFHSRTTGFASLPRTKSAKLFVRSTEWFRLMRLSAY
jgi:hypothetical protein